MQIQKISSSSPSFYNNAKKNSITTNKNINFAGAKVPDKLSASSTLSSNIGKIFSKYIMPGLTTVALGTIAILACCDPPKQKSTNEINLGLSENDNTRILGGLPYEAENYSPENPAHYPTSNGHITVYKDNNRSYWAQTTYSDAGTKISRVTALEKFAGKADTEMKNYGLDADIKYDSKTGKIKQRTTNIINYKTNEKFQFVEKYKFNRLANTVTIETTLLKMDPNRKKNVLSDNTYQLLYDDKGNLSYGTLNQQLLDINDDKNMIIIPFNDSIIMQDGTTYKLNIGQVDYSHINWQEDLPFGMINYNPATEIKNN